MRGRCPACGEYLEEEILPGYSEGEWPFIRVCEPVRVMYCPHCGYETEEEPIDE